MAKRLDMIKARAALGWGYDTAAAYAQTTIATVQRWENGAEPERRPWLYRRYCAILGLLYDVRPHWRLHVDDATRAEIAEDSRGRW